MTNEGIMQSCKDQLKIHIEQLMECGVRQQNIDIELTFYIRELLRKED